MTRNFPLGTAPHIPSQYTVARIMLQVLLALVPGVFAYAWYFGSGIFIQIALATLFALVFESLFLRLRGRPLKPFINDYSAVVTAVLFALCVPPLAPWWIACIGMLFAIGFAKHLYGGLGHNVFNPAMVGYVVALISFPQAMTAWLPPLALADMIAGLSGAMAMTMAFYHRDLRGGTGQIMDLSLLEPIFSVLGPEAAAYELTGRVRERVGNGSNTASPRNVYVTSDERFVAISASMQVMAERLLRAIGAGWMLDDPRYATNAERVKRRDEVDAVVGGFIRERTLEENLAFFEKEHVTAAPIYDISQIVTDPHFMEREVIVDVEDPELGSVAMHNVTPRLSGTPGTFRRPAPARGEHNAELLTGLGMTGSEIETLTERGVLWRR